VIHLNFKAQFLPLCCLNFCPHKEDYNVTLLTDLSLHNSDS